MKQRNTGMVLVMVLWAVVLLAVVCIALGGSVFLGQGQLRYRRGQVYRDGLVNSADALARAILFADDTKADTLEEPWANGNKPELFSVASNGLVARLVVPTGLAFRTGLLDESARLNANTASAEMLARLPGMDATVAEAFVAARKNLADSTDEFLSKSRGTTGAFANPLQVAAVLGECLGQAEKRKASEKVDETCTTIWASSANLSERVAHVMPYLTVFTWQRNTDYLGRGRININTAGKTVLAEILGAAFSPEQIAAIIEARAVEKFENIGQLLTRPLWLTTQQGRVQVTIDIDQFQQVADRLTTTDAAILVGLVNVNTCSKEVLSTLAGMTDEKIRQILASREYMDEFDDETKKAGTSQLLEVLSPEAFEEICQYITTRSQQFRAYVQVSSETPEQATTEHYSMLIFERDTNLVRRVFRMNWSQSATIFDK